VRYRRDGSSATSTAIAGSYKVAAMAAPITIHARYSATMFGAAAKASIPTVPTREPVVSTSRGSNRASAAAIGGAPKPAISRPIAKAPETTASDHPVSRVISGAATAKP
jgi:hypothetical protein